MRDSSFQNTPRDQLDQRVQQLYESLREVASSRLRRENDDYFIQTTALLHEAYLKLAGQHQKYWQDESKFLAAASATMRRVLIDLARQRKAVKRGRGKRGIDSDQLQIPCLDGCFSVLEIHDTLERLSEFAEEEARVMELMVFSEMSLEQIGQALGLSLSTVQRRLRTARAWLARELSLN